jgi:hypothetical protein
LLLVRTIIGKSNTVGGSGHEVKSQIYRAMDRNYVAKEKADEILLKTQTLINQIGGFIHYLKQSEYKRENFKEPELVYFTHPESQIINH